jgi:predicted metalloenzyme YecM
MMISSLVEFFEEAKTYIEHFDAFAHKHSLQNTAQADHICFKCDSVKSFEYIRRLLESESKFLYQSIISNRRIAYIGFKSPIETVLGPINYLELSDQKPDGSQKEGFDHIEVYPTVDSYKVFVERFKETETVVHVARPHHTTDDIEIGGGFLFRCTQGPLIEKIKKDEFV